MARGWRREDKREECKCGFRSRWCESGQEQREPQDSEKKQQQRLGLSLADERS